MGHRIAGLALGASSGSDRRRENRPDQRPDPQVCPAGRQGLSVLSRAEPSPMAPHAHGERGRQLLRNVWAYLVICRGHFADVLHAGPVQFRTGWFVESLATQTLFIFAIRSRRVPFFRSKPGLVLTSAA